MPPYRIRERFFMAVEGESEQSFITWLQKLSDRRGLYVHLEAHVLYGGGFSTMIGQAISELKRREARNGKYYARFLLVDEDRAMQGDWPVGQLRQAAAEHKITVCLQKPNQEGVLLRMFPDNERLNPDASSAVRQLKTRWPEYQKPVNSQMLQRFLFDDLVRMARFDNDLQTLLRAIGLM